MKKAEAEEIMSALEGWLEAQSPTFMQERTWGMRKQYRATARDRLVAALRGTDIDGSELCPNCRGAVR